MYRFVIASAIAVIACTHTTAGGLRTAPVAPGNLFISHDIATSGEGSPYYRIPALAVTTRGTVLIAFDARPTLGDLPSNIRVLVRRSSDNGRTFGDQILVRGDSSPHGYGDPSFVIDRRTARIFLFYAAGERQGFVGSHTGVNDADPDILQADYSYSDDDGLTWRHSRITSLLKKAEWAGVFASSGRGIQIVNGPYAGRLVQQYTVRYNHSNWAASAYSDDDGATWHMGQLIGPGANENKSVELADGSLMLNVRAKPYRKIAFSSNGGETWHGLRDDPHLIDPGNNGSIIRYAADSSTNRRESQWLLFSNTESTSDRRNLTVKLSCDDGMSWPIRKTVDAGPSAYSTLARLDDGKFALLYERGDYAELTLVIFDPAWLIGTC